MMYNDDGIETMAERFLSFAAGEKRPRRFSFWNKNCADMARIIGWDDNGNEKRTAAANPQN
jgi:hypothetical protein